MILSKLLKPQDYRIFIVNIMTFISRLLSTENSTFIALEENLTSFLTHNHLFDGFFRRSVY